MTDKVVLIPRASEEIARQRRRDLKAKADREYLDFEPVDINEELLLKIKNLAASGVKKKCIGPQLGIPCHVWDVIIINAKIKEAYETGRRLSLCKAFKIQQEQAESGNHNALQAWMRQLGKDILEEDTGIKLSKQSNASIEDSVTEILEKLESGSLSAENAMAMLKVLTVKTALIEPEKAQTIMAVFDSSFKGL
jgi:hypothetical protein